MVNTELLEKRISERGLKKSYLAEKIGISRAGLYLKMGNSNEFTAKEIMILCDELDITKLSDKEAIFFAKKVEKNNSTNEDT